MSDGQAPGFGNFLKPILTDNNSLKIIGATTNREFDKMKDAALKRRFRRINVPEPSKDECLKIIELKLNYFNITNIRIDRRSDLITNIYDTSVKINGFNPDKLTDICDIILAKSRLYERKVLTTADQNKYLTEIIESNDKFDM